MAREVGTLDLRALELAPGAAVRLPVRTPPVELVIGGQEHHTEPERPELDLEVSRSLSGLHLRLRGRAELVGPCVRCLEEARAPLTVDTSEFVADGRPGDAPFDEDLDSQYVEEGVLDVATWARDAVAEAVPATLLCRADCAGLCPHCGTDLNAGSCDCAEDTSDPRWDALREVAERLRRESPENG
jgi:uncharacterized protein